MSYEQFCQNCGLNFQRLSAEEEARYARDPGYCPNCAYQLAGRYPPPAAPPPPQWNAQANTMPSTQSGQRRNIIIASIALLLLVIIGLFVLLAPWSPLSLGILADKSAVATATTANTSMLGSDMTATDVGGTPDVAATQTAIAGGSGIGAGGGSSGGGGSSPTATPGGGGSGGGSGGGGGSSPTATPSNGGGSGNPTATPAPPVVVTISPTSVTVQCGSTTTIVMTNPSSTQSVNWSAHAVSLPAYTLSPSSGTIPPRGSQTMVVSNISKLLPLGTIIVTSGGLPQTVTITCTLL